MLLIKVLLFFCYCVSCKSVLLSLAPHSLRQAIQTNPIKKRKNTELGEEVNSKKRKKTTAIENRIHECDVCHKCFTRGSGLKIHKRRHTGEKPHKCDLCGKEFIDNAACINHKKTHTGKKPHKCDECDKCFLMATGLRRHKRSHTGEKPFQCDVCGKAFGDNSSCNRHKKIHTGVKSFQCDVCGKAFGDNADCNRHKKTHTGKKTHKCDLCKKSFARGDGLNVHKRTQHSEEKFYKCKKCKKKFKNLLSWEWHKKKHSKEKCFHCPLCAKSFAKGGVLYVHIQMHFTNRPLSVSCMNSDCKKQFSDILELFSHCFTKHSKNPKLLEDLKIEFVLFLKKLLKDKKVSDDKNSVNRFFKNNDNALIKWVGIKFKNKKEYPSLEFVEIIKSLLLEDLLTLLLEVRWRIGNNIENQNREVATGISKKYDLLNNDPLFLLDLKKEKLSHQEFALFLKIFLDVFYKKTVPSKIMWMLNKHVTDSAA